MPAAAKQSMVESGRALTKEPLTVVHNEALPIEAKLPPRKEQAESASDIAERLSGCAKTSA